jgi:hypothetical protein
MADVPLEKDGKEGVIWDQYSDGQPIVYEALDEKDNPDAKPRQHGKRSDTIQA